MATQKEQCSICSVTTDIYVCRSCSKDFCFDHLSVHREKVKAQRNKIQTETERFRQMLPNQQQQPFIQQIDQWEKESIATIQKTAEESRVKVVNYTKKIVHRIKTTLNDPNEQMLTNVTDTKCHEIDFDRFTEKIEALKKDLNKLQTSISIGQQPTSFISKLIVNVPTDQDATWKESGITIAGGNGQGNGNHQLFGPYAITFDNEQTMYIADHGNHRIVQWKPDAREGQVILGDNSQLSTPTDVLFDRETNSLIIADYGNERVVKWSSQNPNNVELIVSKIRCSGLAMDKDGSLYVSDWKRHEVRRYKKGKQAVGTVVAGGNGAGAQPNQLSKPTYLFIDDDYSLYVAEYGNHRVTKWIRGASTGIVVASRGSDGPSSRRLSHPHGITVDSFGRVYVVDSQNNRVMRWCEGVDEGTIIIGEDIGGNDTNELRNSTGIAFDSAGNLYVADCGNHRIQKFEIQ